jgi:hypothetical protein
VPKAQAAVAKAKEEFPDAARYFLIMSGEPTPDVREEVERNERWEIWGGSELSIRFLNEVDRTKQIDILQRLFPNKASELILRLYPLRDDPLIPGSRFFDVWNRPGRVFHHRAKLVGRAEELKRLHGLIRDSSTQAIILPAIGGVGKTRLLRALDETFASEHAGQHLYFIDVNARPEMGSTVLRTSQDGELVLIQDDAHRAESLRSDLVTSLIEKHGKIVLATRPHAVDDLKAWLVRVGVDSGAIQVMPELPPLKRQELVGLALEFLPEDAKHWAETLSDLAKGCTLVVTVAAELISQGKFDPTKSWTSDAFQREVFDRFEAESFAQAVEQSDTALARDILRLLAVLAPWNEQVLPLDKMLAVLGDCSPREFQEIFDQLREARLLIQTRQGWRVVPDLFADHLVYRGCYANDGKLTDFAQRLQEALATAATSTVLRNLAEAEWQAKLENPQCASLILPFWQRLKEDFIKSDYCGRTQILRTWAKLSAMQPDRSVELAHLALELKDAPSPPKDLPFGEISETIWSRGAMLDALPGLLEPIAIYHASSRRAALDLLWEAHLQHKVVDEKASDSPLAAIGRAGQFRMRLPVAVSQEVVDWLESKLKGKDAAEFCDQPSPALAVILKPAFEPEVEDNFSDGNVFTIRTFPVAVEATRSVRESALRILNDLVIPRGEIATLNALSVLDAAIDFPRLRIGGEPAAEFQKAWTTERKRALAIVVELITAGQSPRVLYRIRRMLRPLAHRDRDLGFRAECTRVLGTIPDSPDLRIARVLLSGSWSEFFHDTPHEEKDVSDAQKRVESEWLSLVDSVGADIVGRHIDSQSLLEFLNNLVADYGRVGLSPQCWQLLSGVARAKPGLAAEAIDLLLATDSTQIDGWWTSLFAGQLQFPDARLIGWARKVLQSNNSQRQRALIAILSWAGVGDIPPEILEAIANWSRGLRDATLEIALENIRWRDQRKASIDDAILNNLDLAALSGKGLARVAKALSNVLDLKLFPLSGEFVRRFIGELVRVDQLSDYEDRGFIQELSKVEPRAFYDMLVRRIQDFEARRASGQKRFDPLRIGAGFPLTELPNVMDYASLAENLLETFRKADDRARYWWQMLFQDAVLRVSQLGLELMKKWLPEVQSAAEMEEFIHTLHFEGSMIIFKEPEFTGAVILRIRQVVPSDFERLRWYLGHTASPRMRGYVGHQLEPQFQYYREEAAKAAAVHEKDPELAVFYREIVRGEDTDAARQREQAELDAVEWQ